MNRIGDFGFMVAMFMIFWSTGSLDFGTVFTHAPNALAAGGRPVTVITLSCSWAAPENRRRSLSTPGCPTRWRVHAGLGSDSRRHDGDRGVYLVARCNLLFAMAPVSSAVVAGVGALTALFARRSPSSSGTSESPRLLYDLPARLHVPRRRNGGDQRRHLPPRYHAFFKALLFLGSGSVIYALHRAYHHTHSHEDAQDMRNMGGLARYMPWTAALMWIATLAIAGVPPLSGFFSKDEILTAAHARGHADPIWIVFWALALAAALLTAFYMTRLMLYTFHGPNRTGEQEQPHLHEAPWIMTGPLLLLGVLSAAGGVINIPSSIMATHGSITGSSRSRRRAPHYSCGASVDSTEWLLVGIAVAVAIVGIVGAWQLLKPQALGPARSAPEERGFARLLRNKWYVDEIYDALIVRPLVWLSREVLWKQVDQRIIDGAVVNGAARGARALGWANRWLQTGQVGAYVAAFVVGVLLILWRR